MVRNFIFSSVNKEFLIFLFFLVLSGGFWLLMALNETYEKEYAIPVHLVGVPRNVVVTDDMDDTVHVTLRDKGFTLLAYSLGDVLRPLSFRFGTYANDRTEKGVIPIGDAQRLIYQQLYGSSKITQIKPDRLEYFYTYGLSRQIPIRLAGHVSPAQSYYLAHMQFWPEKVTVYANRRLLDSLRYVSTERVNVEHLDDTLYRTVRLQPLRGVKIIPSKVRVAFYPDVLTEETVEVPIMATNMPDGKVLRTFPARVRVHFIVGASRFRAIKASQFKVVADYRDFGDHPSDKCNITLRGVPRDVTKARLEVSQVDYLIEQQ